MGCFFFRVIANYLMWRVVENAIAQLGFRMRQIRQEFYKVMSGEMNEPARWKQCIEKTEIHLGEALGALFIEAHFDEQSKYMVM